MYIYIFLLAILIVMVFIISKDKERKTKTKKEQMDSVDQALLIQSKRTVNIYEILDNFHNLEPEYISEALNDYHENIVENPLHNTMNPYNLETGMAGGQIVSNYVLFYRKVAQELVLFYDKKKRNSIINLLPSNFSEQIKKHMIDFQRDVIDSMKSTSGLRKFQDRDNHMWGYLDINMNIAINAKFENAYDFTDGQARVVMNEKMGIINTSGEYIMEPKYDWIDDFTEGVALIQVDKRFGYIGKEGNIVIDPKYNSAGKFKGGVAIVRLGTESFRINMQGEKLTDTSRMSNANLRIADTSVVERTEDGNSIIINNITNRDVESKKLRIIQKNQFLFPLARNNKRTVYRLKAVYEIYKYDVSYTIGSSDGRRRSGVLRLYQELFDRIGIQEGTVLKVTRYKGKTYILEKTDN